MRAAAIEAAFRAACLDELAAPKPGNVHVHAPGHGMTVADFERSAALAAPFLCAEGAGLGRRVLDAVAATRAEIGQNTNLGILLLCAPLAMAAEAGAAEADDLDLRPALRAVLDAADVADAALVFRAIALAAPGGLGEAARHDVRAPATVKLSVAMAEAAGRDRIAFQYVSGFAGVFEIGLDAYRHALGLWRDPAWAVVAVHLRFLAAFRDSHVMRKHGAVEADRLRNEAIDVLGRYGTARDPAEFLPELLSWDEALKARGINPGTSADLTVATLFAYRLQNILRGARDDG